MNKESKENINFHVHSDDYFATLATIINIIWSEMGESEKRMKEVYKEEQESQKANREYLEDIKKDLLYLQDNFKIVKR